MALTDGTLNSLGTSLAGLITHISLHSADPSTTGANEIAAAGRNAVSWSVDADGDLTLTAESAFTGMTAGQTVTHVGLWSASTGGTFRGGYALSGDTTANSAGQYTVTAITLNGTSS